MKLRGFTDRLVYGRIESNDLPDELASKRLAVSGRSGPLAARACPRKSTYDFRRQGCQLGKSQSTPRAAEISQSEETTPAQTIPMQGYRSHGQHGQHERVRVRATLWLQARHSQ